VTESQKPIEDYIIFKVTPGTDPDQPEQRAWMNRMAEAQVMGQYKRPPRTILMDPVDWLVTSDWREVERFQPAHDCAECQAGNEGAIAFLKEHPDERLALGNLRYWEIW
jgi:hypothetical protein